jgi:hypothetical protein
MKEKRDRCRRGLQLLLQISNIPLTTQATGSTVRSRGLALLLHADQAGQWGGARRGCHDLNIVLAIAMTALRLPCVRPCNMQEQRREGVPWVEAAVTDTFNVTVYRMAAVRLR